MHLRYENVYIVGMDTIAYPDIDAQFSSCI